LKGENKQEVLQSIEDLITILRLLKIKVDSIPDDSELLPYIAFSLELGKTATNRLHKKFMIDQMIRIEKNLKRKNENSNLHILNKK